MNAEREFSPERSSVPTVRTFILGLVDNLPRSLVDRVLLSVSELATNAVIHASSDFTVRVALNRSLLRIEIVDSGGGVPEVQPFQPPSSLHGRGLQIVDQLADRWGTIPSPAGSGKTVWLEMAVDALPGSS